MPTVMRINPGNLAVRIYTNDHRPAHVHVVGNSCEAVFKLNCPSGPPELRENYGFSQPELTAIQAALAKNVGGLCAAWRDYHGSF